jgi:hypothetical protein
LTIPRRFVSANAGVADEDLAQFLVGTRHGIRISPRGFGSVTLASGSASGTFISRPLDADAMVTWDRGFWYGKVPAGATVRVSVRTGSSARPNATWSRWVPLRSSGDRVTGDSRYVQYRLTLSRGASGRAPVVTAVGFTHNGQLPGFPGEFPVGHG